MNKAESRKMEESLKDIKKEIEENGLDDEVVKVSKPKKTKPKKLNKPKEKESKVTKSAAKKVTSKKKVVKKTASKKEITKKEVSKKSVEKGGFSAADLAGELDITPRELRILLRKSDIEKPDTGWNWTNKKSAPIKEMKDMMGGSKPVKKAKAKKEDAKQAKKSSKKKATKKSKEK